MAILVTGGAGFIGSHVCDELLARGKEVVCLDNLNNFYSPKLKIQNILHNLQNEKFHFFTNNIREKHKVEELFKQFNFEGIIHLAARAGVRASIENPAEYRETNITGTMNLLHLAKDHNVKKFLLASTSSVYGGSLNTPFKEEHAVMKNPLSPYAASKLSCENFAYNYSQLYGLNVWVLRYFTVYGPRNRPDMAVHKFATAIKDDKLVELYDGGEIERDFTYVKDIVDGTLKAFDKVNSNFEVINLGNSRPVKVKYLVELLEKNLGKKALIKEVPRPKTDPPKTHADVSKAKELLGWEPTTSIEEGIEKFSEWYKLRLKMNGENRLYG